MIENILKMAVEVSEERSDKIIEWKDTPGFKPFHEFFIKDAIKHPAKANLYMVRWIIEHYTKPNDTVLDMMAGIGSTGIMASLLGRNAVLVEYEQKFVDMIEQNVNQLVLSGRSKGKVAVVKGDARKLGELQIDAIVSSPPYSDCKKKTKNLEENLCKMETDTRNDTHNRHTEGRQRAIESLINGYSDDSNNIGNLPYGKIDSIVSSPPYCGGIDGRDRSKEPHYDEERERKYAGGCRSSIMKPYGNDVNNIGTMKHATYLEAMLQVYRECFNVLKPNGYMVLITKNFIRNKQIVRLDLDTIKLCEQAGFILEDRWYRKMQSYSFWVTLYYKKYGLRVEYEDILVFRKPCGIGNVDAIVSSPPYSTVISSGNPEKRRERLAKAGYDADYYMGGNARNLEIKGYNGEY
ncbi:MAG: DNA methyltransferase [Candidatus Babeliales bacterium]